MSVAVARVPALLQEVARVHALLPAVAYPALVPAASAPQPDRMGSVPLPAGRVDAAREPASAPPGASCRCGPSGLVGPFPSVHLEIEPEVAPEAEPPTAVERVAGLGHPALQGLGEARLRPVASEPAQPALPGRHLPVRPLP